MNWLVPSLISTIISSVILFLIYLYLYFKEDKKTSIIYWVIGWLFYSLRFIFMYFHVIGNSEMEIWHHANLLCSLASGVFLFQGTFHHFEHKTNKPIYYFSSLLLLWSFVVFRFANNLDYLVYPLFLFIGIAFIFTGVLFHKRVRPATFESRLISVLFILWGLHKLDYPFIRDVESLVPAGYILGAVFAILAAFSISLFYLQETTDKLRKNDRALQKRNEEIEFNNERLGSLLKISQLNTLSTEALITKTLEEAIKLTRSKIGYIYFYNEETKLFTLNAWSDIAMKECKVMEKQTVYQLEKTGCWGEAVRQRKPILINDYTSPNKYKKGLPQGHVRLKKFLSTPVFDEGKIVAVVGVANKATDYDKSDITQLTLLMDSVWRITEKTRLIRDLEKALNKAEESDKLKAAFLQNLSHEIRTPMNGIIGFSEILRNNNLTKETFDRYLDIMISSSQQLLSVVTDIVTLSAIETKQEEIHDNEINLNEVTSATYETHLESAKEKGLQLILNNGLPDETDRMISDRSKITQILNNLVTNAIKFTRSGSVEVSYRVKDETIEFKVQDTGIGIEDSLQDKIFERFRQGDTSPSREYGGSGLGLSISKGLVELFGGKIWVESQQKKGSSFYFSIPYKPVNMESLTEENRYTITNDMKILVAEDEITNYLFLEELFSNYPVTLIHAENGEQAVEYCKTDPEIDLVLMDIKMPKMDGVTATKAIREIRKDLLIIAQTAYALDVEVRKYQDVFDGYLTKPIDQEALFKLLDNIFITE